MLVLSSDHVGSRDQMQVSSLALNLFTELSHQPHVGSFYYCFCLCFLFHIGAQSQRPKHLGYVTKLLLAPPTAGLAK